MIVNRDILNNLCINITDGEHASVQNDEAGKYFLLSNKNIINGQIVITNNERKISHETFAKINKRTRLEKGDLVISTVGILGKLAIIKDENLNYDFQRSVGMIKCNEGLLNTNYLYHYLNADFVQLRLNYLSKGAVQKCLFISDIKNLEIDFPDISTQQKIAKVLSDLDAKIEINNHINTELEAMAKTLYDYWFVQFDFPDANGKPYKTSGGKMVWNEELKREIPEGWEVKTLLDIANFVNGLACQKFRPNENEDSYRVIKIREMGTGFTENSEFVSINIPEKVVIHNGDILFSWSATLDVKIWTGGTGALNQHIFKITSKKYPKSYYYFELLNYLQHFKMQAELRKTTMGHITQDHLKQSRITIPPSDLINKLDKILKPILEKKVKLEEENQELASLRDWLLPMLMNGQVRVGEVERELGMVAEGREQYK
jgi:type I restriction enzyme S subunit